MFFKSPTPFCFVQCSRILSLWVVVFHEVSIPLLVIHNSYILRSWVFHVNFNIPASCFNFWDPHMIISTPPKRLDHYFMSALCKLWLTPLYCSFCSCYSGHGIASSGFWVLLLQVGLNNSLPNVQSIAPSLSCTA